MSGCSTYQTHTCPSGSECIFNVTSGIGVQEIIHSTINAQNAKSLQVYCEGGDSQCDININCPINGTCHIYARTGSINFPSATINAEDSSYLYIETATRGALYKATINCPRSSIKGGANGKCVANIWWSSQSSPYAPLALTGFRAQEGLKDISLTCTIANGGNCGPILVTCGENNQYSCSANSLQVWHKGYGNSSWKVYQPDGWRCVNRWSGAVSPHPCDNDFTYTPTKQLKYTTLHGSIHCITSLY